MALSRSITAGFSKKSPEELRRICRENLEILEDYFIENNIPIESRRELSQNIWKLFVSADKRTHKDEYNLFITSIGFTEEEFSKESFYDMTNHGSNEEFVDYVVSSVWKLPKSVRIAIAVIGLCIMGSDREITPEEQALIDRFF